MKMAIVFVRPYPERQKMQGTPDKNVEGRMLILIGTS
jgi:hypothetical protein